MESGSGPERTAAITLQLQRWKAGDERALDELVPLVMADLLRRARRHLAGERPGQSMRSSDILQEAWLQLLRRKDVTYECRGDFFALASTVMRHVLVDHARRRRAARRGGGLARVSFAEAGTVCGGTSDDVLALHEALERLVAEDRRKAAILDMYYFGGMNIEEIGAALGLAAATVHKHKVMAEARVRREISRRGGADEGR